MFNLKQMILNAGASMLRALQKGGDNLPITGPAFIQHRNPRRNAQRAVVAKIGSRQYKKQIKTLRRLSKEEGL